MLLEQYLRNNNTNLHQLHLKTQIPESTLRNLNKKNLGKWNMDNFDAVSQIVNKNRETVILELEKLNKEQKKLIKNTNLNGRYNLENRRYIGNKNRLLKWILTLLDQYTTGDSFFDVFAGTGVVSKEVLDKYDSFILNDFLFSNEIIYEGFFGTDDYNQNLILNYEKKFQNLKPDNINDNYFSKNFGGKFFSKNDARLIGEIRTIIENDQSLNKREKSILISSLLYSSDKIANTVGHYDAYRKKVEIQDRFTFELINPLNVEKKNIRIYREDANNLVRKVKADVAFIDPPYNSRQYSRFYHVLEGIAKWDKPKLEGVAMKPPLENMSEYSKSTAPAVFEDLILNLDVNYIMVTYNNTYNSKSSSSRNKITHEQILEILNKVGETQVFEMPFKFFNAGKTDLKNHKEYIFITEVRK